MISSSLSPLVFSESHGAVNNLEVLPIFLFWNSSCFPHLISDVYFCTLVTSSQLAAPKILSSSLFFLSIISLHEITPLTVSYSLIHPLPHLFHTIDLLDDRHSARTWGQKGEEETGPVLKAIRVFQETDTCSAIKQNRSVWRYLCMALVSSKRWVMGNVPQCNSGPPGRNETIIFIRILFL